MAELDILVVEDDELLRKGIHDRLVKKGHNVRACECLVEARALLDKNGFDLCLLDMRLPDGDGVEFLAEQKEKQPDANIVIMTAFADVNSAIMAIRNGAFDYLPKPFEDEQLEKIVSNAAEKVELSQRFEELLSRISIGSHDDVWHFDNMIGTEALGRIFETAQRIAKAPDTTVLIMGESGTGKGMLAQAIHRLSPRAEKPFVDINCSAIPGQLMESEIFGYERGAFTDAKNRKPGLLEVAHEGSVFLDEIGDMDLNLQGKLLKVIEDKQFRRLGGAQVTKVDVRVIAATNRDLKARVKEGKFREDLYYRLSVVPLVMPPLREHKKSIEPLAVYYLNFIGRQMGRDFEGFTPEAMEALTEYTWPGNVRELRNTVERGVLLCQGTNIDVADLSLPVRSEERVPAEGDETDLEPMSLAECERRLIGSVLKSVNGNKNKAAEVLKIHRTTLYKKIEEYKL